ncbi:hypothetical protein, partial [Bacillus subtilis]
MERGKKMMGGGRGKVKKMGVEVGGKKANIVFKEGDLEVGVDQALNA